MPRPIMSLVEVLALLAAERYVVDIDAGIVYSLSRGKCIRRVKEFVGSKEGHLFVRLYRANRVKTIAVHRLVWMAATGCPIPEGFEIHHWDEDTVNNSWLNLYCLHAADHRKLHRYQTSSGSADEIPF